MCLCMLWQDLSNVALLCILSDISCQYFIYDIKLLQLHQSLYTYKYIITRLHSTTMHITFLPFCLVVQKYWEIACKSICMCIYQMSYKHIYVVSYISVHTYLYLDFLLLVCLHLCKKKKKLLLYIVVKMSFLAWTFHVYFTQLSQELEMWTVVYMFVLVNAVSCFKNYDRIILRVIFETESHNFQYVNWTSLT